MGARAVNNSGWELRPAHPHRRAPWEAAPRSAFDEYADGPFSLRAGPATPQERVAKPPERPLLRSAVSLAATTATAYTLSRLADDSDVVAVAILLVLMALLGLAYLRRPSKRYR